jgi:cell filamentation protein
MDERQRFEQNEAALSFARIVELERKPVEGKFDAAHLREVHRRIFQDLTHHAAGEYRPDAPAHIKNRQPEQSGYRYHVRCALRSQVDAGVEKVLSELGGPDGLRGLPAERFSERMAMLYGDLDYLHPFREGNSRTLRSFTRQLGREAGYELDWNAMSAGPAERDRLYIARDKEVLLRAYPGLDRERAMKTENRAEYEAYVHVLARFAQADTLQSLIKESVYRARDLDAARTFRESPSEAALKRFPDLAGSYALLAAMEKKAEADGLNPQQRSIVMTRARETLAIAIERGQRPEQHLKEARPREAGADREFPER